MRLVRFGEPGAEAPGVIDDAGALRDARGLVDDWAGPVLDPAHLVHHLSQVMVLHPGDMINTGTPAGVALGYPDPQPYLREGDVVECSITGPGIDLGSQRTVVGQA